MGQTGFFHHVGTFLLFAATILLIVTCISAPVVHNIALLKVDLKSQARSDASVTFGTFGYCLNNVNKDGNDCSKSMIGYSPADVLKKADSSTDFGDASRVSAKGLTRAMVLHPIAAGLNFIAFLMAIGAGIIGSLLASVVALLAFIVTVIAMIIDFVLFSIVRSHVNDSSNGAEASYSTAAWTILASAICSLLGTVVVFLTCCSTRMHRRRESKHHESRPVGARRRWF